MVHLKGLRDFAANRTGPALLQDARRKLFLRDSVKALSSVASPSFRVFLRVSLRPFLGVLGMAFFALAL
jgi:hypothetical protein